MLSEILLCTAVVMCVHALDKLLLCSPWNGGVFPIHQTIGGISDTNNHIVGARALHIVYRIFANITFNDNLGANEDDRADDFESEVDKIGQRTYESFRSSVLTEYGFDQEASKAIQDDLTLLAGGYALILFYVCINLGQATRLKHRLWLSVAGIISTGLGMLVSFGLCSAFGLFYGPVHSVLPFLLIGELHVILVTVHDRWQGSQSDIDNLIDRLTNAGNPASHSLGLAMMQI